MNLDDYLISVISDHLSPKDIVSFSKVNAHNYSFFTKNRKEYFKINMKALYADNTPFAKVKMEYISNYLEFVLEEIEKEEKVFNRKVEIITWIHVIAEVVNDMQDEIQIYEDNETIDEAYEKYCDTFQEMNFTECKIDFSLDRLEEIWIGMKQLYAKSVEYYNIIKKEYKRISGEDIDDMESDPDKAVFKALEDDDFLQYNITRKLERPPRILAFLEDLDMSFDKFSFLLSSLPPKIVMRLFCDIQHSLNSLDTPYKGKAAYNVFCFLTNRVVPKYLENAKAKDFEEDLTRAEFIALRKHDIRSFCLYTLKALLDIFNNEISYREDFESILNDSTLSKLNKDRYVDFIINFIESNCLDTARFLIHLRPELSPLVEYEMKKKLSTKMIEEFRRKNGYRAKIPKELKNPDFNLKDLVK